MGPANMSGSPDRGVVFTPSVFTPNLPSACSKLGMIAKMPMDPVIVSGSAKIASPGVEIQ